MIKISWLVNRSIILALLQGIFFISQAQSTQDKEKILIIGLDTSRFFSNVYFKEELAYYNNTKKEKVVEVYNKYLLEMLERFSTEKYEFVAADSAEASQVHEKSTFVELENDYGQPFFGIAPVEGSGEMLISLMEKYQADYLLSINTYEIYRKNPPDYVSYDTRTKHIIHYDIFDQQLNNIYGGRYALTSFAVEAQFNLRNYEIFAREVILRLKAYKNAGENSTLLEQYNLLKEREIKKSLGIGVSLGFGAPYGLFGLEFSRFISNTLELNGGLGYDFSGFKIGAGARLHLVNFESKVKPFIGLNYAYATGNTFSLGGETDEFGNQLAPEDVSRYEIFSDHAIHVKGGARYALENQTFMLSAGYSFPFMDERPILLEGKESSSRMNLVKAMAVGGLDIHFTYIYYFTKVRKQN